MFRRHIAHHLLHFFVVGASGVSPGFAAEEPTEVTPKQVKKGELTSRQICYSVSRHTVTIHNSIIGKDVVLQAPVSSGDDLLALRYEGKYLGVPFLIRYLKNSNLIVTWNRRVLMTKQAALHIASSEDRIMVTIPPGVSKAAFSGVTIRSRHTKKNGTILPIKWGSKTIKRGRYRPKGKAIYFTVETPLMVETFHTPRTVIFHNVRLEDIPK